MKKKISVETWVSFCSAFVLITVTLYPSQTKNIMLAIVNNIRILIIIICVCTIFYMAILRQLRKIKNENDKLNSGIKHLKNYFDMFFVHLANHYNTQMETFEIRFKMINDKLDLKNESVFNDPNFKLKNKESLDALTEKIITFNEIFKEFGCKELGKGSLRTMHADNGFDKFQNEEKKQ